MAIAVAESVTRIQYPGGTTTATSGTLTTAASAGDALLWFVAWDKSITTPSTPTGWTQLGVTTGASVSICLYGKVAAGGETSVSHTVASNSGSGSDSILTRITGAHATAPFGGVNLPTYSDTARSTIAIDLPAASGGAGLALAWVANDSSSSTFAVSSTGWTQQAFIREADTGSPGAAFLTGPTLTSGQDLASATFTVAGTADQLNGVGLVLYQAASGTPVTVTGVLASATAAAPAGTVTAAQAVTAAGVLASASATAPAGTVTAAKTVTAAGVLASATATAPAGSVSTAATVTVAGVLASAAASAPAGDVAIAGAPTLVGGLASVTATAPAGTVTAGNVTAVTAEGTTAGVEASAPAGTVVAARTVVLIGNTAQVSADPIAGGVNVFAPNANVPHIPTYAVLASNGASTALVTTPAGLANLAPAPSSTAAVVAAPSVARLNLAED